MSFWKRVKDGFSRFAAPFNKVAAYLPLLAGVALTLIAILVARHRIDSVEKDIRLKAAPVDVVVASCAIPKGTALSEQYLAKLALPSSGTSRRNVPAREFDLLIGARTKSAIEAGEPILWTDVEEPFELETLSQAVPQGRRALTLQADLASSFSGLLRPGDRVDIYSRGTDGKTAPAWFCDIPVIAVDRHFDRPAATDDSADASTITISVTPDDGKRLAAARTEDLRWFLRNPAEHSRPLAPPGKAFEPPSPVEVWRAGVREAWPRTAAFEADR